MSQHDDPRSGPTALVGMVFVFLFAAILLALQAYFGRVQSEEFAAKVVDQPAEEMARLQARHRMELMEYRWVDERAGRVSIPIEKAMEIVVRELAEPGDSP